MSLLVTQDDVKIPADTFATRLILLRHELGVTVDEISARCGIASATWSTWEHGTRPRDLVEVVTRIADGTGYDRDWLMWGFPLRRNWDVLDGGGEGPALGQLALRLLAVS